MASADQQEPPFETIDESIAYARIYNRWFKLSLAIVFGGMTLGMISQLVYGREFKASDSVVGPFLSPLSFVWLMAFFHMFYVMVKIRLSRTTQMFCRVSFFLIGLLLGKVLVWDAILKAMAH